MVKLVNRAKMFTSTTGTGSTITLGSAVDGFQTFANAGVLDGETIRYVIEDGTSWEIGTGVYTASGTTLSRNVTESSNSDSPINLSGSAIIFVSMAAGDTVQQSDIGTSIQGYSDVLANTTASFTTSEESKLAGIEDNATADQTPSEILTAIKTVDGTGSGLDADSVDGIQGSDLVVNNANNTIDASLTVTGNLDTQSLTVDTLQIVGGSGTQGAVSWNVNKQCFDIVGNESSTLQNGEELWFPLAKNSTGSTIPDATPVYAVGHDGTYVLIAPMIADGSVEYGRYMGLTTQSFNDQDVGRVTYFGAVNDINTSSFNANDTLYVSHLSAGSLINYQPPAPATSVVVGRVAVSDTTAGSIIVNSTLLPSSSVVTYDNSDSDLTASNVKGALDELSVTKADISLLNSNITLYPTTSPGDFNYNRMVTDTADDDYDTTTIDVDVPLTGTIDSDNLLVGSLIADAGLFTGNPGIINIPTIGNISKTTGDATQYAGFYFTVYRQTDSGSGLTVNFTQSAGVVDSVSVNVGGTGYAVGDYVYVLVSGNGNAVLKVSAVSGGVVTGLTIENGGSGYTNSDGIATTARRENLIATSGDTGAVNPATLDEFYQFSATAVFNDGEWSATDRVVIKYWATLLGNSGSAYQFRYGGDTPIRTEFPVPVSVIPSDVAGDIITDTTNFNGLLSGSDTTVQAALDTLDNHTHSYDNYQYWTAQDGDGTQYGVTSVDVLTFAEGGGIDVNFTADDVLTFTSTDTLDRITGRGAYTSNSLTVGDITVSGNLTVSGSISNTLDDFADVTVTSIGSGEILKWNGTGWINNTLAEAGIQPAGSYVSTTSSQALHPTDALSIVGNVLYLNKADGSDELVDLSVYLDDTNLSRIVSGVYDANTSSLVFTRDDASTFSVDASMFFDDTNLVTSVNSQTGAVTLTYSDVGAEQADATILKDADIGVTVQGYDANTVVDGAYVHTDNNYTTAEKNKLANNSVDVTLAGTGTYLSIVGQTITVDPITESDIADLGSYLTDISGESLNDLSDVNSGMTPTDGQVLTYDTTNGWQAEDAASGGAASVTQSATAPSPASAGDLWFDTENGTLNTYYDDTWVVTSGPAGPQAEAQVTTGKAIAMAIVFG